MHRLYHLMILVAVLAGASFATWESFPASAEPQRRFVLKPVVRGDVEDVVTALGSLQPSQYVDVGAQVSGQLQAIHVAIGDRVDKGTLLAEIDSTVYQAKVNADQAFLENLQAQVQLKDASRRLIERQLARQKEMLAARATSQEAYDAVATAMEQNGAEIVALRALVRQTQANLTANEAALRSTKIHAPLAGTVVSLTVRPGQSLNASQTAPTILRIADLDTMTVWTQVSEGDIPRLAEGMDVYFTTLGRPNRRWTGKLRQILPTPEIVNNVVLYNALFDVDNRDKALLPHMSAQVFFVVQRAQNVLLVPTAALKDTDDHSDTAAMLEVMEDGRRVERRVETGVSNRVVVEIKSGVTLGEQVVVPDSGPEESQQGGPTFRFKWPRL